MLRRPWAVFSLLLSIGVLLLGHGMQLTVLPLIAEGAGWPASANALTTSVYFAGFAAGCVLVPWWIRTVGHIRVFLVLVATMTSSLLIISLQQVLGTWVVLRFVYGIAIAGVYLAVESWLNAQTPPESRGSVMSGYAFVTLVAIFLAQLTLESGAGLNLAGGAGKDWLTIAAICLALASIPIGLTRRPAPPVLDTPRLKLANLVNPANGPAVLAGMLSGAFWALAPVFALRLGVTEAAVPRFMAAVLAGGMLVVYPLGRLSDRVGRTRVIAALGAFGGTATLALIAFAPAPGPALTAFGVAFGAASMPLYPLSVALANDRPESENFVETGSVVLLMHAVGLIIGPALAGWMLGYASPMGLAWFWAGTFAALVPISLAIRRATPRELELASQFELVADTAQVALQIDPRAEVAVPADAAEGGDPASPIAPSMPGAAAAEDADERAWSAAGPAPDARDTDLDDRREPGPAAPPGASSPGR